MELLQHILGICLKLGYLNPNLMKYPHLHHSFSAILEKISYYLLKGHFQLRVPIGLLWNFKSFHFHLKFRFPAHFERYSLKLYLDFKFDQTVPNSGDFALIFDFPHLLNAEGHKPMQQEYYNQRQ